MVLVTVSSAWLSSSAVRATSPCARFEISSIVFWIASLTFARMSCAHWLMRVGTSPIVRRTSPIVCLIVSSVCLTRLFSVSRA